MKCYYKALHKVQAIASSADLLTGKERVGAFLWAALWAYQVTAEYEKHDNYRHPGFASVLQMQLYKTYVQKDDAKALSER